MDKICDVVVVEFVGCTVTERGAVLVGIWVVPIDSKPGGTEGEAVIPEVVLAAVLEDDGRD